MLPFMAFASGGSENGKVLKIKLGHGGAVSDPRQTASEMFKREVENDTNGKVIVEIYPCQ